MKKILHIKPLKKHIFIIVFALLSVVLSTTTTYAWFSSVLTNINGGLNLGNLAAQLHIYENYDDSLGIDNYIDGLTDANVINSGGTTVTEHDIIEKDWYSNAYTSVYLQIENTGSIDLKSILKVSYDNSNLLTYLTYYYYQLVDITQDVNAYSLAGSRENLSAYNENFQTNISSNLETYINNVTTNGYCITSSLSVINMGTTEYEGTSFYRLDIALSEIPSELLTEYNLLPISQREITINALVTIKQTNAPDGDDEGGVSVYVSNSDSFVNALNSALNGDTIYLTSNISVARNITITHRANIILNGYTLTISGNFAYDIATAGIITLDVSNSSVLNILGNFIIDTPYSTFRILGSGSSAQSIFLGDGVTPNVGGFYVHCLKDDTNTETYGYYQYGVSVMKRTTPVTSVLATMTVDSNTRVSIGLSSTCGPIVSTSLASNIEIYNYGEIYSINLSNMLQLGSTTVQIYIHNSNEFTLTSPAITLPSWSLGWMSKELGAIPNAINTRIINAPGSVTGYSVAGSLVFLNIDIENGDIATDSVIDLSDNNYRVNIELDGNGYDTRTVRYYLQEFYINLHNGATEAEFEAWATTIQGLALYTYNSTVVKTLDFTFMDTYVTNLKTLDLSYSSIENDIIPASAFYNKVSLENIYFPVSELEIGASAFSGTSIKRISLSSSIVSIGLNAFDINTSQNGLLEAFYEGENISSLLSYISGLTASKTLLFMSPANTELFKAQYAITDTWYINSYTEYDFIDEHENYYRIIDGSSVEVVYYGGDWTNLNIFNTVVNNLASYRVTGISYSAYRRAINTAGTTAISINLPSNIITIKSDAFYGAYINNLNLNNVTSIYKYAFYNATITTSSARPITFFGMLVVGEYAFAGATIGTSGTTSLVTFETFNVTNGVINNSLDLKGSYSLGNSVFDSASFYGVKLNLTGVSIITANMTNNLSLYGCELYLNNVTEITDSAFESRFKSYNELYPYNKVFAQEVKTIGMLAFKGMYLSEFSIGVKSLYISQAQVNSNCSYGGITDGMIYSDFRTTTLTIDGMLPQIASGHATFLFGSATAGRIYTNVYIKNTSSLLYDFMFYASSAVNFVSITNLYLYDIATIGSYAFYYSNVTNVYFYSGEILLDDCPATSIGEYAFQHSTVASLGDLTLTSIGTYAFADTITPATSIAVNGTVGDYAFYNAETINIETVSIMGTIGAYIFNQANIHTVTSIYINGTILQYMFYNARIYDCTNITFEDTAIMDNTFNGAIISSSCYIDTIGVSSASTLAFYNLEATTSTLDLTNCLTISHEALKKINVLTVRLGNTNFYNTQQSNFIYGTVSGGIFTQNEISTITNLYIDGELPIQRFGTYVLGANGANLLITNIYITADCTNIPENTFYSENISGALQVDNLYIESEDLTIGELAFRCISIGNIIYDAQNYGTIEFVGESAFYFATIGNFTNFTYYSDILLETTGVLQVIEDYTFQYTTFEQDANLTLFNYVTEIGNYAFDHATFTPATGGVAVSFDFTKVPTIGYNIFNSIYTALGTITLGNSTYYQESLLTYYYGNPAGSQGIFTSSGAVTIGQIIIAGNLPDSHVNEMYQTRALGLNAASNLTITTLTINANVTNISAYAFSGFNTSYRTVITTLNIYSSALNIKESAFAYTNITNFNIYSADINLNEKSFEYSILTNMTYDRTSGVGEITFNSDADYTFSNSTIYVMTGFADASSGVFKGIGAYAFYYTTFASDCNLTWINFVENIKNRAFMYATFSKTSLDEFVEFDLTRVISLGEEIFSFIPIKIGELTLGNSTYAGLYGDAYYYGQGVNGVLYGAGTIDTLNIVGNLPTVNSYNALGNSYVDSTWSVKYGVINIDASVTDIPASAFISQSKTVPVIIGTININSTNITIGTSAFYYAQITTVNFNNSNLTVSTNAFNSTTIATINIVALNIDFGNSAFANSFITTIDYNGTNSGTITMSGPYVFESTEIDVISGFTYTVETVEYGIVENISSYAFQNATFATDCDISWIQYVDSIGSYAFSGATFNKTSSDNFVNLNLTQVVTIGDNVFYHLQLSLGTVTIGNSSYVSNPLYEYGDGVYGIFNNAGIIQHLIIDGDLPTTAYSLGNRTSDITYLTTYDVVEINAEITHLPEGLFAGLDTVYATNINSCYIFSTDIEIGAEAFNNTVIGTLYIPYATTFSGTGASAFKDSSITTLDVSSTLSLASHVNDYAFYGFDFTGVDLDVETVSYIGEYAFSYATYDDSLVFNSALILIDGDYMFSYANISGNLTFNNLRSLGSNSFYGLISGTGVTYTFTFSSTLSVTSDYAFANMNGGGSVYLSVNGLPTLNSYRAFYNSTNIITIVLDETLLNLEEDNVFESATNLVSIALNNEDHVVIVNETITTIPDDVKIYVPGSLLAEYLMNTYWSLVMDQISTTYNIDSTMTWGFYILDATYNASLVKYLGSSTSVTIPETITYDSQTYTIVSLGPDVFSGTSTTVIYIPRAIQYVDMDLFSNSNIEDASFVGTGTAPFYIETDANLNKVIYDSLNKLVLYKYLPSNESISYTIEDTVIAIAERAFYQNPYIESIIFEAGNVQSGNINQYIPEYPWDLSLSQYAISENPNLTDIHLQNNTTGYGVLLSSYAIASNPSLETLTIIGFSSIVNSYSVYNNTALTLAEFIPCTSWSAGNKGKIYANISVEAYAFFGSGSLTGTTCFYTSTYNNAIFSHAFANSRITLFEFDIVLPTTGYCVDVYNSDAFAVGVEVYVNGNGDIVQTYEDIVIRVLTASLATYQALPGFSFYYSSIVGVSSFTHVP